MTENQRSLHVVHCDERKASTLLFLFKIKSEIKRSKQGGTWDSVSSENPLSKLFRRK